VIALAVIAQRLAVITRDDNNRAIDRSTAVESIEQSTNLCVAERKLADVRITGSRAVGFGRIARPVRIVQMHPQEARRVADFLEPPHGVVNRLVGRALAERRPCSNSTRASPAVTGVGWVGD
jgi:hypothetical protein